MVLLIDKDKIQSYSERNDSACCREMWNGGGKKHDRIRSASDSNENER